MTRHEQALRLLQEANKEALTADGFEEALIGYVERFGQNSLALYDRERCIEILMGRDGMDREGAEDFFESNVIGVWMGENTPAFVTVAELTPGEANFRPIRIEVLGQTGEEAFPWVFSMGGMAAYPGAFLGCADETDVADLLFKEGVLFALKPETHRNPVTEKLDELLDEVDPGECCDYGDDLFVVRFADRYRAVSFLWRLNSYLRRVLSRF